MTIEEVKTAKAALEVAIQNALDQFLKTTGCKVSSLDLQACSTTAGVYRYIVGVEVRL
jgi:hypothetical protein